MGRASNEAHGLTRPNMSLGWAWTTQAWPARAGLQAPSVLEILSWSSLKKLSHKEEC